MTLGKDFGFTNAWPEDRTSRLVLIASAVFGLAYLFNDFGLAAPFPANVAIKAAGIVLLAVYALRQKHLVLAVGLALGAIGDIFLALDESMLPLGIAAFGLGHLVYIWLFARWRMTAGPRGGISRIAALAVALAGLAMMNWLQPHFGDLQVPATVYNGIILVMAVLAILGRAPMLALIGALLFVISDSVLAVRLFAGELDWAGPVVWVCYYLGQAGIALGLAGSDRP
ncbi:lysoplasmalogenase [Maricaulis sp.]|uniref:lysoplasmalogenase n=1 Tax=Maricaulis sp. TaxID=1486257 RepID=UPI0025BCFCDE|nr:lysoplasmalogenase [Maricaulis sp.]